MIIYQPEDELLELDELNPVEKYKRLRTQLIKPQRELQFEESELDVGELSLIALYVIDKVIKKELDVKYNYYIQDDMSVKFLLNNNLGYELQSKQFLKYLIRVDDAKLIYRFTCAKKFEVNNERTKQLRINSWGRQYIDDQHLLNKYSNDVEKMTLCFSNYLKENRSIYVELTELLLQPITSSISYDITQRNQFLDIKLLS
ncbi:hypothetical protein [Paenibacillus antarcticus]|uniref:Uncharacterized protein n=1 Tax=Paenibacillus antarcticus TaxID=253703 RepID=A0A168QNG5_9BACL|nr:hypothetical protein [Paenibacillus antarcticus]OAB47993.1 hypothetical protein PBAT_03710 [Paenibacillus antarcticus]